MSDRVIIAIDPSITSSGLAIKYDNKYKLYTYSEKWHKPAIARGSGYLTMFLEPNKYEGRNNTWRYMHSVNRMFKLIDMSVNIYGSGQKPIFAIENYSFGSKGGLAFSIGEYVGCIKAAAAMRRWDVEVVAPTMVKKFWTGKGNSDKAGMADALVTREETDLLTCIKGVQEFYPKMKIAKSCIEDIIDAYALCKYIETI